jgi:polyribonucleotide nucleotidyltransferase
VTGITIPHSRSDTKIIVKAAFEISNGIKTYYDDGTRVTGKSGTSFGLLASSYGEQIIVEIPDYQPSETETMVSVTGKKEVSANIGADPEKYVSQVINNINKIKNKDVDTILEVLDNKNVTQNSKEVSHINEQAGGKGVLILILIAIFFFVFIMPLVIL